MTLPFPEDVEAMRQDIRKVRGQVDVLVLSFHWGIHHIPRIIPDYEALYAEAAFNAGADMIVGHHAHVPKAIQVINGKVCFHSLSNFIMTTHMRERLAAKEGKTVKEALAGFAKKYGVTSPYKSCNVKLFPISKSLHESSSKYSLKKHTLPMPMLNTIYLTSSLA